MKRPESAPLPSSQTTDIESQQVKAAKGRPPSVKFFPRKIHLVIVFLLTIIVGLLIGLAVLAVRVRNLEYANAASSNTKSINETSNNNGVLCWKQVGPDLEGETTDDWFGYSVALSGDGKRLAVGAIWNMNVNGEANAGQARVFERRVYPRVAAMNDEGTERWMQIGTELEGNGDFGASVGLSENGTVLTATGDVVARIYRFDEDDKSYYHKIGNDFRPDGRITLSPDGNAIGVSPNNSFIDRNITIVVRDKDAWKLVDSFVVDDIVLPTLGYKSVLRVMSLMGDGSLVITSNSAGHFRTYQLSGGKYVQLGQDLIFNATDTIDFESACFSANAKYLAIGAFDSVRVFVLDGNSEWRPVGGGNGLVNTTNTGGRFGTSVALSADGSVLAVGDIGGDFARVFRLDEDLTVYQQLGQDLPSKGEGEAFGNAISLSADGTVVAVGGPSDDGSHSDMGYVRVFELQE